MLASLKYLAIIGLVPCTESGCKRKLRIIISASLAAYNVGMGSCIFLASIGKEDKVSVGKFVNKIMFANLQFCMAVALLEAMFNCARYSVYNQIVARLDAHLEYAQQHSISVRKYLLIACVVLVSISCNCGFIALRVHYNIWLKFTIFPAIFIRAKFLLLLYLVEHLEHYLTALAENLQRILAVRTAGQDKDNDNDQYAHQTSLAYLLELKQFYLEISQLNAYFNELHGCSMLSLLLTITLDTLYNIYWLFSGILGLIQVHLVYVHGSHLVLSLLFLVSFCMRCEYCKRQHLLICTKLRRLMRSNSQDATTFAYTELLEEFLMQLQQNKIAISALGFMRIDLRLLASAFTALLCFIVFLMQFRLADLAHNPEI